MSLINDVTVIIRSAGERTERACYQLLATQVEPRNIFIIHEHPFSTALKKSYEIGIEQGKPWTACVDADVLLVGDAMMWLRNWVEQLPSNFFEAESHVLDKFFGGPVPKGCHWYRTSLLPQAIQFITDEHTTNRPETYVLRKMRAVGHDSYESPMILGLHDFEQFYHDIYRKILLHTRKNLMKVTCAKRYWQRNAKYDGDFRAALKGYWLSQKHWQKARLCLDALEFKEELRSNPWPNMAEEKKPLNNNMITPEWAAKVIERHEMPPEYMQGVGGAGRFPIRAILIHARDMQQHDGVVATLCWLGKRVRAFCVSKRLQ